jgi:hypothetical protein
MLAAETLHLLSLVELTDLLNKDAKKAVESADQKANRD